MDYWEKNAEEFFHHVEISVVSFFINREMANHFLKTIFLLQ